MMLTVEYRKKPLPMEEEKDGPSLVLTPAVVRTIDRLLPKRVGNVFHANVLYIAGVIEPSRRLGVAVIAPKAETGRGHYHTDRASHAEVLDVLGDLGLVAVAQVHCHPGQAVYHSDADDDLAFVRAEGHWSIVVPYYGRRRRLATDALRVNWKSVLRLLRYRAWPMPKCEGLARQCSTATRVRRRSRPARVA